ncbi:MAG: hypothetical protein JJ953_14835 [Gracilimonas sp.]|uniref:hypothetical protein n=1 Tax=Gracilimonas TaxID=649462 RepID=UPI001AFF3293|nr:hypothetical protein [Gracilimonas sp.]MBO6587385.1 hypothetical protein [Gracilimonas sp.]MBO6614129.1 hypothetical protein [Gracilimonas sp.]
MQKLILFMRGCVLGATFFAFILWFSDAGIMGERSLTFLSGIAAGILLFGYVSMKFPNEFWKAWFPNKSTQQ